MTNDSAAAVRSRPTSLARRFWIYQAERYSLLGFVPLITVFTFSSAAYSRLARGASGFVDPVRFAIGALTAIVFFFVLRVLDEHKDADVDRRYRPELPVPRGLVSLAELRAIAGISLFVLVGLNAVIAPILLVPIALVAVWAALMTKEFFVRDWLRAHPTAYLLTHMAIMPLIDGYTTGLDWLIEGAHAPSGLGLFLAVTFANGVLIEVGRKLRAPSDEREGVDTYTRAWGLRTAPLVWVATLIASGVLAGLASRHTGTAGMAAVVLAIAGAACTVPALRFLARPTTARARHVELASQLWPTLTYLLLGAAPFMVRASGR